MLSVNYKIYKTVLFVTKEYTWTLSHYLHFTKILAPGAAPTPCWCRWWTSMGGRTSPTCSPSWPETRVSTLYPCLITNQISRHLTFCFVDYSENRQKTFFGKIVTELIAYYDYLYRFPVQHQMFGGRRSRLVCCVLSSCLGWFVILKINKPYEC